MRCANPLRKYIHNVTDNKDEINMISEDGDGGGGGGGGGDDDDDNFLDSGNYFSYQKP